VADSINEIVTVSITANSKTPSRLGFGTPLVLTYHTHFAERWRAYTDLAGLAADGFTSNEIAYNDVAELFSQNPAPTQVIVGRLPAAPAYSSVLTALSAVEGQTVKFSIRSPVAGTVTDPVVAGGTISPVGAVSAGTLITGTYVIPASATTTTVATAVEQLVEAVPGVASTSSGAAITAASTGTPMPFTGLTNLSVKDTTADVGFDDELTALQDENDDWYFILIGSGSEANIAAVAAWTLAHPPKLFFARSSDSDLLAGSNATAIALKAAGNDRVAFSYHQDPGAGFEAGWVGVGAPQDPGAITWALRTVQGVLPSNLTATQRANLEAQNVNYYTSVRGISITRPGKVSSGEWIDVRHGIDALTADIQESVFALLANSLKVPFTGAGLDVIANTLQASIKRFEGSDDQPGLLIPKQSVVIMPTLASISLADKQARQLKNVRFTAKLAGAIHFVSIIGTVSN
jgi:uncharacterized protein DUF3383